LDQALEDEAAGGRAGVEGDAELVRVDIKEEAALLG